MYAAAVRGIRSPPRKVYILKVDLLVNSHSVDDQSFNTSWQPGGARPSGLLQRQRGVHLLGHLADQGDHDHFAFD